MAEPATGADPDPAVTGRPVQATVARFDPVAHDGSLLFDDGRSMPFDRAAFDAAGLRLLRVGQRVRVQRAPGDGPVVLVTLLTLA